MSPQDQSLSLVLRRSAQRYPGKPALIFGDESWTFAELDRLADEIAGGLLGAGIASGDRVAIVARNSNVFLAIRFAVARIAAVLVPVNVMLAPSDIAYILAHSEAMLVFADAEFVGAVREALAGADTPVVTVAGKDEACASWQALRVPGAAERDLASSEDLLQIVYTSGTESRPKGAMLSHGAVLWEYQSCLFGCEWSANDVTLHALPLFHCAALDLMAGPAICAGATAVIIARPSPEEICTAIGRHRVTSLFAPPTVWIAILQAGGSDRYDLSSLTKGYYGASIMPVAVIEELARCLPQLRLWNVYGQTEIAPLATLLSPEEHPGRLGSAGRAALHVQTRVVDDQMNDVNPGGVGEIVHRSPQLLSGYWKDPEKTAEAFEGGWFHSGDLATIDADGYITVVDRKKDMIKSGGENVSSREVEEVIYSHPKVAEVAVIGLPDDRWIEVVAAVIVLRAGETCAVEDIARHCAHGLAGFKRPKHIFFADSLPKNASGKILKRDVRATYGNER